jgi:single-stranded-DNA-specific exonuclease
MKWELKSTVHSLPVVQHLARELQVNEIIARLLLNRGINSATAAACFFNPQLSMLHDPFLMKDMEKAVNRLSRAIRDGEKILVFGDYDVDGTTGVSLVYLFLRHHYPHVGYYIPDRYREGYGISFQGIDHAAAHGFTLIVALDCGIKSHDKVEYARSRGIDFIICDHHQPDNDNMLPAAVAVLDPKREDCSYPYDELPGCAIGFKLMHALALHNGYSTDLLFSYLDLVAIAIAADIVPITGENRILTHYGLKLLNETPRPAIQAMLITSQLKSKLNVTNLVFGLAPRINSAGRMKTGYDAVRLLTSASLHEALQYSLALEEYNRNRKDLDKKVTEEAVEIITSRDDYHQRKTTVVYHPDWHKGILGIVASRLVEKHFYRPTIVLTHVNGKITGSARSVKGFDLYSAVEQCSDLLEQFGGHTYAAGLTLKPENLEAFTERFEQVVSSSIPLHLLERQMEIDAEIDLTDITEDIVNHLRRFEPHGPGNLSPLFASHEVFIRDPFGARIVGNNHLKLAVTQRHAAREMPAIAFSQGDYLQKICSSRPFSICYHIEENEFNNQRSIQLNVKDMICQV